MRRHPRGSKKRKVIELTWGQFEIVSATAGSFDASYTCDVIVMPLQPTSGPLFFDGRLVRNEICPPPVLSVFRVGDVISGHFAQPLEYSILMLDSERVGQILDEEQWTKGYRLKRKFRVEPSPLFQCLWKRMISILHLEQAKCECLFVDTLAQLGLIHLIQADNPCVFEPKYHLHAKGIARAIDFINSNLDRALKLDTLAGVAALSTFHFARIFKKSTGESPHKFVTRRRLTMAKQLLTESDLPIVEIALMIGFASQSHLTTLFRQNFGITPSKFRKDRKKVYPVR